MRTASRNGVVHRVCAALVASPLAGLLLVGGWCHQGFAQAAPAAAKATTKPGATAPAAKPAVTKPAPIPAAPPAKPAVPPKADTSKTAPKDEPPPAPESSFQRTKDGWNIFYTFYGPKKGVRPGKAVVPIIMLHGWHGQGSEYAELATILQHWGFASIVPDFRGHGRSLNVRRRKANGEEEDKLVKADDLTPLDLEGMVNDVETMKRVLLDKNNEGELNLEMLTLVASDVGAIAALNWSALDWSFPITPAFKQGQWVKALVLLSPQQTFKRLNANAALGQPAVSRQLSILIAVGDQQQRDLSEAKRIHSRLERLRPAVAPEERATKQDLFFLPAPTPLQGVKLLDRALPVGGGIMRFLDLRLLRKQEEFPWAEVKNPLG